MSRDISPFGLRMPPAIKTALEEAARDNRRSLNAEIVARLEQSIAQGEQGRALVGMILGEAALDAGKALTDATQRLHQSADDYSHVGAPKVLRNDEGDALQGLDQQQRQAIAAVLNAAVRLLGLAPEKKANDT